MSADNLEKTDREFPAQKHGLLDRAKLWLDKFDGLKQRIGGTCASLALGLSKAGVHGVVVDWLGIIGIALTAYGGGDYLRKAAPDNLIPFENLKTGNSEWDFKLENQNK